MNRLPYLPHELIIHILLRLPVKSLRRFKCVCKSWFSLISDTQFANSQFQLTAATHTHRALFTIHSSEYYRDSIAQTRSIDLEASLDDDDTASVSLNPCNFVDWEPFSFHEIKGSCRGFILLLRYSRFYVWNPSTGFHRKIPLAPNSYNLRRFAVDADHFFGFGYDQSTNDYLVVSISAYNNPSYLEFFSLRDNMWELIDDGTDIRYWNIPDHDREAGSLFNGAIHWFARSLNLEKRVIIVFDLMERKLLDMHLPDGFVVHDYSGIWVFQEFLSLWAKNSRNDTVEIWVMKEYKVHLSWTKTHVLPIDGIPTKNFIPLCSTKSGDIVGTDDHIGLVKYNDEGQLLGHQSYGNNPRRFQAAVFIESLLSLPGDNVQED